MKKYEIRDILQTAAREKGICRMYLEYEDCYRYLFPIKANDKLFMYTEEDDFLLDGFCIRNLHDVEEIERGNDKCSEIAVAEGLLDGLDVPEIDISSWQTVAEALEKLDENIIVECESPEDYKYAFNIGRIEAVIGDKIRLRHFDGDGVWENKPRDMPMGRVAAITFRSRYINIFSKYLPKI